MRTALILVSIAVSSAVPAAAQEALRDLEGRRYCNVDGTDLREDGKGGYKASFGMEFPADVDRAVYPAGQAPLFARHPSLKFYVTIGYQFDMRADGTAVGKPRPTRIAASTGRFAGAPLGPLETLELKLQAGELISAPMGINPAIYGIGTVSGELAQPVSPSTGGESPSFEFRQLVLALESKPRFILLFQDGAEAARIPVPQQDIKPVVGQKIAWFRKTLPLLAQGKCG